MNFANDIKTVEMAQSYVSSVYLAKVKAVAFAVISSGYRSQALLYTHSDQLVTNAILGDHAALSISCWVQVDFCTAGDETTLQIFGLACISRMYSARGKYSSIPLVVGAVPLTSLLSTHTSNA